MRDLHLQYTKLTAHLLQVVQSNRLDCTKGNVANLLSIMWLAQQPVYRISYYNFCCLLTRFSTIYYKPYIKYMEELVPYIKLILLPANNNALWGLESYYYTSPDVDTLSADDLYHYSLDYTQLLPYNKYMFRADLLGYMVLWSDIERVRQKKYNEYVRTHYLLNTNAKRYSRESCLAFTNYRATTPHLHRGIYTLLRTTHAITHIKQGDLRTFIQQALRGSYRILMLKVTSEGVAPPVSPNIGDTVAKAILVYYQQGAAFAQRRLTSQFSYSHLLSVATLRSLWVGDSYLDFDYVFRTYPQFFPSQMRLQLLAYIDYPIVSSLTPKIYSQLVALHGGVLLRRETKGIINNKITLGYLLYAGMIAPKGGQVSPMYHWSHTILRGLISNHVINPQPLGWVNSTWLRWQKKRIPKIRNWTDGQLTYASTLTVHYMLWGKYYKITNYLAHVWMGNNYFYLRSFNYSLLNKAHGGRLHWKELLISVDIDKFILLQLGKISQMVALVWANAGLTVSSTQLGGGRASYEGAHRGLTHLTQGYVHWCDAYSYITWHLFTGCVHEMEDVLPPLHNRIIHGILRRHMGIRRYLLGYRTKWYNYRRYPYNYGLGTCIHSTKAMYRYIWLDHVNWMRIIGLKKEQLPYYSYNVQEDYLTPLAKAYTPMSYGGGVFVTHNKCGVANPRSYSHIDTTTLLYTTF